jgi:hypothetical protein
MAVSEAKRTICHEHWDETDRGCAQCPLRRACHSSHPPTIDGLNQHRAAVNQLASQILRDGTTSEFVNAKPKLSAKPANASDTKGPN